MKSRLDYSLDFRSCHAAWKSLEAYYPVYLANLMLCFKHQHRRFADHQASTRR